MLDVSLVYIIIPSLHLGCFQFVIVKVDLDKLFCINMFSMFGIFPWDRFLELELLVQMILVFKAFDTLPS